MIRRTPAVPETVTVWLREVLDALQVSQVDAAEACDLDPASISRYCRGERRPELDRARQMLGALDRLARMRGIPLRTRRSYLISWLISLDYLPRTLSPAGRRVCLWLACLPSQDQERLMKKVRATLKEEGLDPLNYIHAGEGLPDDEEEDEDDDEDEEEGDA